MNRLLLLVDAILIALIVTLGLRLQSAWTAPPAAGAPTAPVARTGPEGDRESASPPRPAAVASGQFMVVAERNGPDRRAVQLKLLATGTRVLRKAPGPFAGVLPDALARLDAATLERLDADLAALLTVLHADERASGIPLAQM